METSLDQEDMDDTLLDEARQGMHEAIKETIRICKERNILTEYLQSREKEVEDIVMATFEQKYLNARALKDAEQVGQAKK